MRSQHTEHWTTGAHQLLGAAEGCVHDARREGAVQTPHLRQARQLGVRQALRHHHGRHREACCYVSLHGRHSVSIEHLHSVSPRHVPACVLVLLSRSNVLPKADGVAMSSCKNTQAHRRNQKP